MSKVHIEVSEVIDARPDAIYAVLADYETRHPAILPKPYFSDLIIEKGGQGAGTDFRLTMTVFGMKRAYRMVVSEPEPGRVLVEMDAVADLVTRFTLDPLNGGKQARLTISTDFKASPGIMGFMEKWTTPPVIRRIYTRELQMIADYVHNKGA